MAQSRWPDHEAKAYRDAFGAVPGNTVTACAGWTAHDVLAHAVAGGGEIARLVRLHLAGEPIPATISFEEREPAARALPYDELVQRVSGPGIEGLLETMANTDPAATFAFTGWELTADDIATHVRSERALHRWDLVGSDEISISLLSQPELSRHAVRSLNHLDVIAERTEIRTRNLRGRDGADFSARIRVPGQPDVRIEVDETTTDLGLSEPDDGPALTCDAAARLLLLWGRQPAQSSHTMESTLEPETLRDLTRWLHC